MPLRTDTAWLVMKSLTLYQANQTRFNGKAMKRVTSGMIEIPTSYPANSPRESRIISNIARFDIISLTFCQANQTTDPQWK